MTGFYPFFPRQLCAFLAGFCFKHLAARVSVFGRCLLAVPALPMCRAPQIGKSVSLFLKSWFIFTVWSCLVLIVDLVLPFSNPSNFFILVLFIFCSSSIVLVHIVIPPFSFSVSLQIETSGLFGRESIESSSNLCQFKGDERSSMDH